MVTDPEIKAFGDVVVALWAGSEIVCEFARFSEHRDSLSAELTVSNKEGTLHWSRINLASATGRRDVIKALDDIHPIDGWRPMLDRACQLVARFRRTGDPAVPLEGCPPKADRWLITDWMPKDEITVLYGTGGSAKSLLCLSVGLAGILGHTLGGPWAVGHIERVLYLDWEDHQQTQRERMWGLTHLIESPDPKRLLYRRLRWPLVDVVAEVRTEAWREGVDFVVMDSLGAACGPEPETAGAALGTLQALGSLPGTKLVAAHVAKASAEQPRSKPFGSVYVENTARSTIEARGVREGNEIAVTLRHDKANHGAQAKPVGVTATFDPDGTITMTTSQPDSGAASLSSQILSALGGGLQTVAALSEQLDAKEGSIKSALNRLAANGNRSKVLRFERSDGGKGKETQWGLRDTNRSTLGD